MKVDSNKLVNIPEALKEQNIFCGFYNDKEGKLDKKPISIVTKRGGLKPDSSDKLTTFTKAVETYNEGKVAAIGVGLSPPVGIICIDLDCHKYELQDKYNELKTVILSKFRSYAENSVSGTGVHIYVRAVLSEDYKNKDSLGIVEVFDNRFVVVTGGIIDGRSKDICEEQEALDWLCETFLQKNVISGVAIIPPGKSTKTDQEIIDKIKSSHKGRLLMDGQYEQIVKYDFQRGQDIPVYASKSEADLSLCNKILYYNMNDLEQATRIFKDSGMAKGLNKKAPDYLKHQMLYASMTLQSVYDWAKHNDNEALEEPEEIDIKERQNILFNRVRENGFCITDNDKLNEHMKKYILNYGLEADRVVIDTTLLDLDGASNGRRFYTLLNRDLIYNPKGKEWARWDHKRWVRCYDDELLGMTQKVFDNIKHEAFYIAWKSAFELDSEDKKRYEQQALELFQYASTNKNKRTCMEMIEFSKSHFDQIEYLKLETPLNIINLSNGIYNFDKMQFFPHSKEYYQTMISSVVYDQEAVCPIWEKMIERVIPGENIRHYVHKAVGYTISAKFGEKALFILHGSGNNGKTTFINVLLKIMGDYSVVVFPQTIMENNSNSNNGPRPDLLKLRDKRFAAVSESNENDRLSEGIIKSLTGAGYISCRTLHKEPVEFRSTGKYWFDTNHKPVVKGTDGAIWSRLKVIPFETQIPKSEIDVSLGDKLEAELSGILNWCIEGYRLYITEGLAEPEEIRLVVEDYAESMSAADQFWKECIEVKTDIQEMQKTSVNSKELYQSYKNWCNFNGEFCWSQRKFTAEINKKEACKLTKMVHGIVRYKMIKLNELGELCYKKDTFFGNEFSTKYNECINRAFARQARLDSKLQDLEAKEVKTCRNVITMPSNTDLMGFGQ